VHVTTGGTSGLLPIEVWVVRPCPEVCAVLLPESEMASMITMAIVTRTYLRRVCSFSSWAMTSCRS
jgi:hypothetical protein